MFWIYRKPTEGGTDNFSQDPIKFTEDVLRVYSPFPTESNDTYRRFIQRGTNSTVQILL